MSTRGSKRPVEDEEAGESKIRRTASDGEAGYSPSHWRTWYDACRASGAALIDLRSRDEFAAAHFAGATSVPAADILPGQQQPDREASCERGAHLPPKGAQLCLLANTRSIGSAAAVELAQWGYRIHELQHFWQTVDDETVIERGDCSRIVWQPSPCLAASIEDIERSLQDDGLAQHSWQAIDLACGSGRDLTWLALRGWRCTGVDLLDKQVARVPAFAAHYLDSDAVRERVRAVQMDMEVAGSYPLPSPLDSGRYQLVNVARYLHRPLFAEIDRILAVGGCVCYHTFMDGCQHTPVGRPRRPAFLLQPGELAAVFGPPRYAVLLDQVHVLPDGRPTSLFVARKTPPL